MLETLLQLTWDNPIFMLVAIGAVWFIPGIVIRRITEKRREVKKREKQAQKIARLYPPPFKEDD